MCGLASFLGGTTGTEEHPEVARRMSDRLVHRGPDDGDERVDPRAGAALAFRRLSIVDHSSAVTAYMQMQNATPVKTFSIGFEDGAYEEAVHAKEVARHLGTHHLELCVTSKEAVSVVPNIPTTQWLRRPLRNWAQSRPDGRRLRQEGCVDEPRVTAIWRAHIAGKGNWQQYHWTVLLFQSWAEASAERSLSAATT